jgi:hypothetical protein
MASRRANGDDRYQRLNAEQRGRLHLMMSLLDLKRQAHLGRRGPRPKVSRAHF